MFLEYLKPINDKNLNIIKQIINTIINQKQNMGDLKEYLLNIFENIYDFNKLDEKQVKILENHIIEKLKDNKMINNKKNELKNKYENNNYIIKYNDFANIIKENNICMDNLVIEYLLYKMKCGISLGGIQSYDNFNFKIFIDFLDKNDEKNQS